MLDALTLDAIRAEALDMAEGPVTHGFFTRAGGVSEGIYRGLNLGIGSDDDPGKVAENRRRAARHFGVPADRLIGPHQVHSPDVVTASAPFPGERPKADGIVTATPNLVIGVLTADCGPVLFADNKAAVIGAAHAGWKGAHTGVLENTVAAMEKLGANRRNITAVLGPLIRQKNYEVGPEFVERFTTSKPGDAEYFRPSEKPGHSMFDLEAYIVARLEAAGVEASALGLCTYEDEDRFFSYRRTTHRGEPDYGRQMSAIMIGDR